MQVFNREEISWGMGCHLIALSGLLFPPAAVIGPLVFWLIKKDEMEFVNDQGKESLNFQITCAIFFIICFVLLFVVIGFFLMVGLFVFWLVFTILAAVKASNGELYRYPVNFRFIK
jgi:uncharacterized Tic20 family protein